MYMYIECIAMLEVLYMWQSRIEIEHYSVVYFERITELDTL